ncbi:MAG: 2-C-methyl-D-erythritol 4-phosphate cytidylyltransferase [Bacteroidetes bacterium]|nr:MAG: 2-C-methyl-D-erythritol 4-phosphate cytidylyltransferase [Bacteroidota bacterium]
MQLAALIVAGGSGSRMGAGVPKQFLPLGGKPILVHTLRRFLAFDPGLLIVLVLSEDSFNHWQHLGPRHLSEDDLGRISLCPGGESRTQSVFMGLQRLAAQVRDPADCLVAIHDGVRPFATEALIAGTYRQTTPDEGAVACVPVKASLRRQAPYGKSQAVDRSQYLEVQTPQTFVLSQILAAYRQRPHDAFSDDASLFEAQGGRIRICEGSYDNIKITTPEDLFVGERILARQSKLAE